MTNKEKSRRRELQAKVLAMESILGQHHKRLQEAGDEARKATTWINASGQPKLTAIAAEMAKARGEAQRALELEKQVQPAFTQLNIGVADLHERVKAIESYLWGSSNQDKPQPVEVPKGAVQPQLESLEHRVDNLEDSDSECASTHQQRGQLIRDIHERLKRLEHPPDQQPMAQPPQEEQEKSRDPRNEYGCLMDRIRELEAENAGLKAWQARTQEAKQQARDANDATLAELRETRGVLSDREDALEQALHLLRFFVYDAAQDEDHQWDDDAEPEVRAAKELMQANNGFFEQGCTDPDEDDDEGDADEDCVEDFGPLTETCEGVPVYTGKLREIRRKPRPGSEVERMLSDYRQMCQQREGRDFDTIQRLIQALADATQVGMTTVPATAPQTPEERERQELNELAWGLIANAHQGDFEKAPPDWRQAAERWRDRWLGLNREKWLGLNREKRDEPERSKCDTTSEPVDLDRGATTVRQNDVGPTAGNADR